MAIAPYFCNARFVLPITVRSVTHEIHLACNSNDPLGTGSLATMFGPSGASISNTVQVATDLLWGYIRPLYEASASAGNGRLEAKLSTGWGLIGSATPATPAGSGSAINPCTVVSLSFKAADNTFVKLRLPETNVSAPDKKPLGGGANATLDTLSGVIVSAPVSTDISAWFSSRSNQLVIGRGNWFSTLSKQYRRKRGLL